MEYCGSMKKEDGAFFAHYRCKKFKMICSALEGSVWSNYKSHLKGCYGCETELYHHYLMEAGETIELHQKTNDLHNYLGNRKVSNEEDAMYHLIILVVIKNLSFEIFCSNKF